MAVAEGLQQHCVIPLANRGRALGALVLARTTDGSFSPDELEFLAQVSGQIAIAVRLLASESNVRRSSIKCASWEFACPVLLRKCGVGKKLNGNAIAGVGTLGEPDDTHAALAKDFDKTIRAKLAGRDRVIESADHLIGQA